MARLVKLDDELMTHPQNLNGSIRDVTKTEIGFILDLKFNVHYGYC